MNEAEKFYEKEWDEREIKMDRSTIMRELVKRGRKIGRPKGARDKQKRKPKTKRRR